MDDWEKIKVNDEPRTARDPLDPHPRAVGSPLPRGSSRSSMNSGEPEKLLTSPQNHPLPDPPAENAQRPSGVQRAVNVVRSVVPFVQKLLPLLDGNVVTAVTNVLAQQPKPMPPLNLAPIEEGVAELQMQQRKLRDQVAEQHTSLKRVEGQLERVREATDRNTLEQQELMVDLKKMGKKVNVFAWIAVTLLLVSMLLNLVLFLRIQHVLP
jgi:hypothetical protein